MSVRNVGGRVFGVPGGGLRGDVSWAANRETARVGRTGELRSGVLLGGVVERGGTVFHDVRLVGSNANADHVVVSGCRVTVVDSKVWRPGVYWWCGGLWRGFSRVSYGGRADLSWVVRRLRGVLSGSGVRFARPVLLVWSSQRRTAPNVRWLWIPGTRVVLGEGLTVGRLARLVGVKPADEGVVGVLAGLVRPAEGSVPAGSGVVEGGVGVGLPPTDVLGGGA